MVSGFRGKNQKFHLKTGCLKLGRKKEKKKLVERKNVITPSVPVATCKTEPALKTLKAQHLYLLLNNHVKRFSSQKNIGIRQIFPMTCTPEMREF